MAKSEPMGIADGEDVAQGTTTDAAYGGSGPATVISLLKKIAAPGGGSAVTIADGANVVEGAVADAAVVGDNSGTISAKLRGLTKILNDVWDSVNHRVKVDGSGVTQPISAASLPLPTGAAQDATLTGGTQKAIVRGGAKGTTAAADVTSNPVDANTQALHVDGSKVTQPVSIAATVSVDTELPASAATADGESNQAVPRVGGMCMVWNGATWDRMPGAAATGVKVDVADRAARLLGRARLTDDTNLSTIKPASTAVAAADTALVVAVSPNADTKVNVDQYGGSAVTLGQKAMASSEPVVIASDQSAIKVQGDTANAATDAGNPVKTGGLATFPALPTLVATGQRVNNYLDLAGAQIVRKRPLVSYTALYRLADATAGTRVLSSGALTANTSKQVATIYHGAAAAKRVQIKYVGFFLAANTVAGLVEIELQALSATTAPATGNPAITPGKADNADAAAEATCLALPTTAGSLLAVNSPVGMPYAMNHGIIAADTNPRGGFLIPLWDSRGDTDGKDLIMRVGVAEGYAVYLRSNAASTISFVVVIIFTEE